MNSNQEENLDQEDYGVIIGVGSNIEAEKHIQQMLPLLSEEIEILKISTWLDTAPVGMTDQPNYTNGAILGLTSHNKEELNERLKEIEDLCGRERNGPKYGPRTMDLDILVWEGVIIDEDVYDREFLQTNILELIPNFEFTRD